MIHVDGGEIEAAFDFFSVGGRPDGRVCQGSLPRLADHEGLMAWKMIKASDLDTLVQIQRPVPDEAFDGAGSGEWERVGEEWVNLQDSLPSRAERLGDGINVAARPARIRMYYRDDITPAMRFVVGHYIGDEWHAERTMQIVAGPAILGRREGLEFMAEDYNPAGNPA
jgi:head-tail adaptor